MKELKKSMVLIGLGVVNLLHAGMHILQFIQSILLIKASTGHHHHHHHGGILETMLHSPYFAILWGMVGLFTLWIGIRDFIHHRKCNH